MMTLQDTLTTTPVEATAAALPPGFHARAATLADAAAVTALYNRYIVWQGGAPGKEEVGTAAEWRSPGFNLATDSRVVLNPAGEIVAYYDFFERSPYVSPSVWGRVHPEYAGRGLHEPLLAWGEARARQSLPKAPPEARVTLASHPYTLDQAFQAALRPAGFELARYGLRMVIDLEGKPAAPVWPAGVTWRAMRRGQDERPVIAAVEDSFRDHWGRVESPLEEVLERWQHTMDSEPQFDPALWFMALDGDEVAGVSLCWPKSHEDPDMGWVGTLGVRRPWRRRGLGLALLQHSFVEFYRRGQRRVGLGVDAQSLTGATRLYERAGMRSDPARMTATFHKVLRPGVDLSTQAVES